MPTQIATIDKSYVKMRWKEEYVTVGLNKKMFGLAPAGIIRGGVVRQDGVGQQVYIDPDPVFGDNVFAYSDEANGFQTTVRVDGTIGPLDLSADSAGTVYLCVFVDYSQGAETTAEFRTYTEAEWIAGFAEQDSMIVLAKVYVRSPIILSTDIVGDFRTEAWAAKGHGQKSWVQIIKNAGFDRGFAGWDIEGEGNSEEKWSVVYGGAEDGSAVASLLANSSGVPAVGQAVKFPVRPGQELIIRAKMKGHASAPSGQFQAAVVREWDEDLSYPPGGATVIQRDCQDDTWETEEVFYQVPAGVYFLDFVVYGPYIGSAVSVLFDFLEVWVDARRDASPDTAASAADALAEALVGRVELPCLRDYGPAPATGLKESWDVIHQTRGDLVFRYNGGSTGPKISFEVPSVSADGVIIGGTGGDQVERLYTKFLHVSVDADEGVSTSLYPDTSATFDIGASKYRWANMYLSGTLYAGTVQSDNVYAEAQYGLRMSTGGTPPAADTTRDAGTMTWDATKLYVKTADTDGWKYITFDGTVT